MAPIQPMNELLTIGELSSRSRLPISTLRYYHEIGLLEPACVDPSSNYRYYRTDQVEAAVLVSELRRAGLSPGQMERVLSASPRDSDAVLRCVKDEIAERIETDFARLVHLDALIELRRAQRAAAPVAMAAPPARPIVSLDRLVRFDRVIVDVRRAFVDLRHEADYRAGVHAAIFPVDLDVDDFHVTVYVESTEAVKGSEMSALSTVHRGRHEDLWIAYRTLLNAACEHDVDPTGQVIERYLQPEAGEPVTEVVLPLQESRNR